MPIKTYKDKTLIVCTRDVLSSPTAAATALHDKTLSAENTLTICDNCAFPVRFPKSMTSFLNAAQELPEADRVRFEFDYVICFDCLEKDTAAGEIDHTAMAKAGKLLTKPMFLGAGEWCMHSSGQGRHMLSRDGKFVTPEASRGTLEELTTP